MPGMKESGGRVGKREKFEIPYSVAEHAHAVRLVAVMKQIAGGSPPLAPTPAPRLGSAFASDLGWVRGGSSVS